MATLKRFKL